MRVNGRNMVEYFKRATHVDEVIKPFLATKTACAFDVRATVAGGGLSGQLLLGRAIERAGVTCRGAAGEPWR